MDKLLRIVILIATIVAVCTAITVEQKMKANEHAKVCVERTGVSTVDVSKALEGDFSITDKRIECFAKCFFELSGFMNSAGDFLDDVAIEKLSIGADDKTKAEALVNTCKLKMGEDPCETAYKIYQCYIKHKAI